MPRSLPPQRNSPATPAATPDWTGAQLAAAGLDPAARPPLRRRVRAAGLEALTRTAAHLPTALLRPALGALSSSARHGKLAARARTNLEIAFGATHSQDQRDSILRACFAHGARQAAEWLRLSRGADPASDRGKWIENAVHIQGNLEPLLDEARGAIVVTAHIGNWELLAAALRRSGVRGAVVGRVNRRDGLGGWLPRMRAGYGVPTQPQDSTPRELLRVLAGGGTLGLLCDLEVRRLDGEFLPFFGRDALTMTAPAALARAAKLPLIPVRCVLPQGAGPRSPYRLSIEDPIPPPPRRGGRDQARATLTQLLGVYERWIKESPEQWAWHQHRWRTRPGDYDAVPMAERRRIDIAKLNDAR